MMLIAICNRYFISTLFLLSQAIIADRHCMYYTKINKQKNKTKIQQNRTKKQENNN